MALNVLDLKSPLSLLVVRSAARISARQSLAEASQLMRQENVSALLVDDGKAIVSERDMTRALAAGLGADCAIGMVATVGPVIAPADMAIVEAAALMLNEEVRHLVVQSGVHGMGIVSLRSVLAVLLQAAQPEPWLAHLRLRVEYPHAELWLG
jgi:signal-transduction protein with cAMP-binding, CBS, and nucleotidyltransferase domain